MGESHDLMNLDWVQADIEQSLQQAQNALEAYLEDAVSTYLQTSYDAIHQVRGSLQMAGVPGAVMLAEQVENLLKGMLAEQVEDIDGACNALAQALVYMPSYLNRVKSDAEDAPALLHAVMNDIRQVLGEEPIDELALFNPDLGSRRDRASADVKARFDNVSPADLRKFRQVYQFALIGLIRREDIKDNAARLSNVLARLQQICLNAPINQLWEVSTAFVESLLIEGTELNAGTLDLLRSLEREIKEFIHAGVFALDRQAHPDIMKGMLYWIAKSSQTGPHIQSIRQAYDLDRYELSDAYGKKTDLVAGPDPETFRTVAAALGEELERVKDSVDMYMRSADKATVDVSGMLPSLNQISSTLVMLNFEAPRRVVQEQVDALSDKFESGTEIPESQLLQVAEALLFVEAELETLAGHVQGVDQKIPSALIGAASEVVVNESLSSLRKAKEMIYAFLEGEQNFNVLESVPNTLRSAYGGLAMLSQSQIAQLVLSASQYVEDDIIAQQQVPDDKAIEALAEVMASIEYCLEDISSKKPINNTVLERAKVQIAKLGYPVEQKGGISSDAVDFGTSVHELEPSIDSYDDSSWQDDAVEPDQLDQDDSAATQPALHERDWDMPDYVAPVNVDEQSAENIVIESCEQEIDAGAEVVALHERDWIVPDAEPEVAAEQVDDDLIDEEILEIFAEEALEVFEEIDRSWPAYAADDSNHEALADVRRAFHTLKGSGRMVKADVISELAWSVENMLNRLIEGELLISASIFNLIDDVRPALPALLTHFQAGTTVDIDVLPWMTRADQLAAGEAIDAVDEQPAATQSDNNEVLPEQLFSAEKEETIAYDDPFAYAEPLADEPIWTHQEPSGNEELSVEADELTIDFEAPLPAQDNEVAAETDSYYDEPFETEASDDSYSLSNVAELQTADVGEEEVDTVLFELFVKEAEQHLETVQAFINEAGRSAEPVFVSDDLYRALHTLKGSAKMAMLDVFAGIAEPTERLALVLINAEQPVDAELHQAFIAAHDIMVRAASFLPENPQQEVEGSDEFVTRLLTLCQAYEAPAGEAETVDSTAQAFIRNNVDCICDLADGYDDWREQALADSPALISLLANSDQLCTAANEDELPELHGLLAALTDAFGKLVSEEVLLNEPALQALDDANTGLIDIFDAIAASQSVSDPQELVNRLANALQPQVEEVEPTLPSPVEDTLERASYVAIEPYIEQPDEEVDAELIEIFLEEAEEILEHASIAKQRWIDNSADANALDELQRCLHTLKGGARMAGIMGVGDLSHELESVYEDVAAGKLELNAGLYDTVHACDDRIMDMLTELRTQLHCSSVSDLINQVREYRQNGGMLAATQISDDATVNNEVAAGSDADVNALLQTLASQIDSSKIAGINSEQALAGIRSSLTAFQNAAYQSSLPEAGDLCYVFQEILSTVNANELAQESTQTDLAEWLERLNTSCSEAQQAQVDGLSVSRAPQLEVVPEQKVIEDVQDARKPAQDNVRVSASLLEHLVDLAGETSVSRSRVEQQVNNYGYAIDEVGSTIERLREQLRRLENETETQILFRQERDGPTHEGFDPLEMDRYSRMQELSRALMESVSDLLDLKETLRDQVRVTDNLLLQQSRTNTELHEGLMKARMVPFSRLVPRLRRLVRQVSGELKKRVDLNFKHPETELDRALLEQMTAPLEHMLRNAVDHGMESAEQRKAAGKPVDGQVTLSLVRDGGDIVLQLQDDGAGIDIERVRAKAIERGLMAADAKLTDREILQFILQQGISTAKKVTQISGRGVGLDVVHSGIHQLGGSIAIDSEMGKGTTFTVRLPFTVSISRALMVNVGEEEFALPLSTFEGVVRINPYELEEYFKEDGPDFEYAGVKYDLHYLGDFVDRSHAYQVQGGVLPLPVILVRTADHAIAVQVDSISGSREVVVKPLGQQFRNVPGMSGATILGDGRVVLILDMAAMIREHLARAGIEQVIDVSDVPVATTSSGRIQVMVIDDSVTVRKVASRLLERHGMEVILAKDGVEAMTKLQDVVPDIMLLDIEMPRMDGFELASLVRHDENLSDIPIIMISSRTGDKHQARAREIGVNQFMGKPFQEADLLQAISELTGAEFEIEGV